MARKPSRFADIKAALSAMGIAIQKTGYGGELRVYFKGAKASEGYYTDDLEDAFGTGKLMADRAAKSKYKANPMKRHATKKPAFGKKKAAKLRKLPTKDHRRKRTAFSRKEAIIAMRNPSLGNQPTRFVVRAVKHDGDIMYFDGAHFRAKKKEACIVTAKAGDEIMRKLEDNYAVELKRGGVKYLDVVQA